MLHAQILMARPALVLEADPPVFGSAASSSATASEACSAATAEESARRSAARPPRRYSAARDLVMARVTS